MKYEREVYMDLIGRWLHGSDGFIERIDADRSYSSEKDVLNIWVRGQLVNNVRGIKSIENNKVVFEHGVWIDLNDDRKEAIILSRGCASCESHCKKDEICIFFKRAFLGHNYNEVHAWSLDESKTYGDDDLMYWWDVPDE